MFSPLPVKATPLSTEFLDRLEQAHQETIELDEYISKYSFLLIGGNGFLGSYLCRDLVSRGAAHVRVMSRSAPAPLREIKGVEYVRGSVTAVDDVERAMEGIDIVYNAAAYMGMPNFGYRDEEERRKAFEVNQGGMENVIQVAKRLGHVKLVVYTSSVDVVFSDKGYVNVRESDVTYRDSVMGHNPCHYQSSKAAAEQLLLSADDKNSLRTAAIRPGGIFGPQDEFVLPKTLQAGWYTGKHSIKFTCTDPEVERHMLDFSFAPNIAFAHSLLVRQLSEDPDSFGGKAYFIHDDHPMCVGDSSMFKPIIEAVGITHDPSVAIPGWLIVKIGNAMEMLSQQLAKVSVSFNPPLTAHEAMKSVTHHTHSIQSAKEDFGYYPLIPHEEAWEYTAKEFKGRVNK